MKNRYDNIVLEAEEGLSFSLRESKNGSLIIKATRVRDSINDCRVPPVPQSFMHILGEWNTGFVIKDKYDSSEYVWVPVKWLAESSVINGIKFEKNFANSFYDIRLIQNENQNGKSECFIKQVKSVLKYGGFYISRYNISNSVISSLPHSLAGKIPQTNISFKTAKSIANNMVIHSSVSSHLVFNEEYDCVLEWLLKTGAKTEEQIDNNSSSWGNFSGELMLTGHNNCNNICDLSGNVSEFVQLSLEYTKVSSKVAHALIRGGSYKCTDRAVPVSASKAILYETEEFEDVGFRVALTID